MHSLLLIAHGSRRPKRMPISSMWPSNCAIAVVIPSSRFRILELAEPDIETGAAVCVDRGATDVILLPYFLSPGKHVVEDLAAVRDRLQTRFPECRFVLAEPLGRHPLVIEILEQRAKEVE